MKSDKELLNHIEELYNFMAPKLNIKEKPKIEIKHDEENAKDFYGKTAYYDPQEKKIALFVSGRHAKDIARSFAHELIHHMQNEKEPLGDKDLHATAEVGYAQKNKKLRDMEEEAFTLGNMLFREFTDRYKMKKEKKMSLKEQLENAINVLLEEKAFLDKEKSDLDDDGKLSGYEKKRGAAIAKAMGKNKKLKEEEEIAYEPLKVKNFGFDVKTFDGRKTIKGGNYYVRTNRRNPQLYSVFTYLDMDGKPVSYNQHIGDVRKSDVDNAFASFDSSGKMLEEKSKRKSPKQLAKKHAKKEVVGKRSEGPGKELKNQSNEMSENYIQPDDRLHPEEMQKRDELIWEELLKKFKIPTKKEE